MKRRDFLKAALITIGVTTVAKTAGIFSQAMAAGVPVKENTLGYKLKPTDAQTKAGKSCASCSWFKATSGGEGHCTLAAMQTATKSKEAIVKETAVCNMWKKKA